MRATSIIFRRELGAYLRNPIGWVITGLILLVIGILFQSQALGEQILSADVLRKFFFLACGIPLIGGIALSFRLLAEERQNHSMVLLNTSPVRDTEIVLGKFFAALVFMAAILALSVYMPLLIKVNGKVTGAQIFVGYFGLLLMGAATLAIGIFASALTKNQLIALVVGAAIVTVMCQLFPLSKRLDPPVRDVLAQLDLWWTHYQASFMNGVLNLKDVIFYLATTYFFLLLSVKTLEAKRWA